MGLRTDIYFFCLPLVLSLFRVLAFFFPPIYTFYAQQLVGSFIAGQFFFPLEFSGDFFLFIRGCFLPLVHLSFFFRWMETDRTPFRSHMILFFFDFGSFFLSLVSSPFFPIEDYGSVFPLLGPSPLRDFLCRRPFLLFLS